MIYNEVYRIVSRTDHSLGSAGKGMCVHVWVWRLPSTIWFGLSPHMWDMSDIMEYPGCFFGVSMTTNVTARDAGVIPRTNFNNCDGDGSGALALQIKTFGA